MKIMKVIQQCEELTDFEEIKKRLIANNWNPDAVIAQERSKNLILLTLINCANQSEQISLQF